MITLQHMTATYPSGKGVFDLNFNLNQGQTIGYLGPNGAGKTTTIRVLLGLMKPDHGTATIDGMDCFAKAATIQKNLGYLAGEMSFLPAMTGSEYLTLLDRLRGTSDHTLQKQLLDRFELSPKGSIQKYSKGMKQKLGLVCAMMHNPDTLILDEPTSGLDPLMQNRFVQLIQEQQAQGKTILLSSHIFEEIQRTCDQVLLIKEGKLVAKHAIQHLKQQQQTRFLLQTTAPDQAMTCLANAQFQPTLQQPDQLEVAVSADRLEGFLRCLIQFPLQSLTTKEQTLEELFLSFYQQEVPHE